MKNQGVVPEDRTNIDYFDSRRTEEILKLQDENARKFLPVQKNFPSNLDDGFNDQKEPRCFEE